MKRPAHNRIVVFLLLLALLDGIVWSFILAPRTAGDEFALYFLDAGQGDAALITFPGDVQVLIDGGPPNGRVLMELSRILPVYDRYIDVVVMTHAQVDHFGGLLEVLKNYRVGMFVWNGRRGETQSSEEIPRMLAETGTPSVALRVGDSMNYGGYAFFILSPSDAYLKAAEANESGLVALLRTPEGLRALYASDVGSKTEALLVKQYGERMRVHVLKVGHHGSRFSSSDLFLAAVQPQVAVIGVGKNSYGHPTAETLSRLEAAGAGIFRTDHDGTVKIEVEKGMMRVLRSRERTAQK